MDGLECLAVQAMEQRIIPVLRKVVSVTNKTKLKNKKLMSNFSRQWSYAQYWSSKRQGR